MNRPNKFNPIKHVSAGVESTNEPMTVAYNIQEEVVASLEPIEEDDGLREVHDQIVRVNGLSARYDELESIEERLIEQGEIKTTDIVELETKFPEITYEPSYAALESYDIFAGAYPLEPALEASKNLKSGLALLGLVAIIKFALKFFGDTRKPPEVDTSNVDEVVSGINSVISGGGGMFTDAFKLYSSGISPKDVKENVAEAEKKDEEEVVDSVSKLKNSAKELKEDVSKRAKSAVNLGARKLDTSQAGKIANILSSSFGTSGVSKENVIKLFKGTITFSEVLKLSGKKQAVVLLAPVIVQPDGLKLIQDHADFFSKADNLESFNKFIDSLKHINDNIGNWQASITDRGGSTNRGEALTLEGPLMTISNGFITKTSKKFGWPISQSSTEGNKVTISTYNDDAPEKTADMFKPIDVKGNYRELLVKTDLKHLDNFTEYGKAINELNANIAKWKAVGTRAEKYLTDLADTANKMGEEIKKEASNIGDDQKKEADLMMAHVNRGRKNFQQVFTWIASVDTFSKNLAILVTEMTKGLKGIQAVIDKNPSDSSDDGDSKPDDSKDDSKSD